MYQKIPLPKTKQQWQLLFLVYIILIAIISLFPAESSQLPVRHIDKVGHFLVYVLMAILALIGFKEPDGRIAAVLSTFIIAILLEWGQSFVPGRIASLTDGITNFLGLGTGFLLFWLHLRRHQIE